MVVKRIAIEATEVVVTRSLLIQSGQRGAIQNLPWTWADRGLGWA